MRAANRRTKVDRPSALDESEAQVRAVLESALDAVVLIDEEGRIVEFNPAAEAIFGRSRVDVLRERMSDLLIPPAQREAHERGFAHLLATGEGPILGHRIELTGLRADGAEFPVELTVSRLELAGRALFAGYLRDISERRLAEEQVRKSEERYRDLFENASEPIATVDLDTVITEVNAAFAEALGYDRSELLGTNIEDYLTPEGRELSALHRERKLIGHERTSAYEQTFVGKDGREVTFAVSTRLILEDGVPVGVQGTCRDVTTRKADERELHRLAALNRHQALHDQLTELPNRAQLHERIEELLAESAAGGPGFALLMIDLDRFKEINDSLGHLSGDLLLREIALRLHESVREHDMVARLGGDEFAIIVPGLSESQAGWRRRVEEVKRALERPVFVQDIPLEVEASVGIAFHPEHGDNVELLLQRADVAMYVAKHDNRGHAVYHPSEDSNDATKLALLGQLRHAIDNGELTLRFQPMIALEDDSVRLVEALVRWQHPTLGLVAPSQFIPIAERTALIRPLTRCVLDMALEQCSEWERQGHVLGVAVNLSARNLSEPDLVDDIIRILDHRQLDPDRLLLEITESAIMSDPARTDGVLRTLSGIGVRLAIDDFGAGYTSLAHLARLPLDKVKIDRSFVAGTFHDDHDRAVVHAIVELCRNLGLRVVAEAVESESTLEELRALGCDLVQGHLFCKPLHPDELTVWLESRVSADGRAA